MVCMSGGLSHTAPFVSLSPLPFTVCWPVAHPREPWEPSATEGRAFVSQFLNGRACEHVRHPAILTVRFHGSEK